MLSRSINHGNANDNDSDDEQRGGIARFRESIYKLSDVM